MQFRMKDFPVFCVKIHLAYRNLMNLDMVRVCYAVILTYFMFTQDTSTKFDYSATIITLIAIIIQSVCAYIGTYKALKTNNYRLHRVYYFSKFPYLLANIYERIVVHVIDCKLENKDVTICNSNGIFIGVLVAFIVWNVVEAYFILIAYCFIKKVKNGDYGPPGSEPLFFDEVTEAQLTSLNASLIKETRGYKPPNIYSIDPDEVEISFPAEEYIKHRRSEAYIDKNIMTTTNENDILLFKDKDGNIVTHRDRNIRFIDLTI